MHWQVPLSPVPFTGAVTGVPVAGDLCRRRRGRSILGTVSETDERRASEAPERERAVPEAGGEVAEASSATAASTPPKPAEAPVPEPWERDADAPNGRNGLDDDRGLGTPGRRFSRTHPFYMGFVGTIGVLTAWLLGNALVSARSVLILIVVALYLAIGLNPVVEWCVRRGVRRGIGVLTVIVGVLAVFGLMALAIVPVVTEQIRALVEQIPGWLTELQQNPDIQNLDQRYDILGRVQEYLASGDLASNLFGGLLGFGRIVFGALFSAFTVLVLTLYFLSSLPAITHAVYELVPRSRRDRVSRLTDVILYQIGRYVGGQIVVAVIAGTASFLFLSFFPDMRGYALALAIAVAVLGMIPLVGGLISAVLVTAIGFLTGLTTGVACLIFYIVYQQVENYVIYPRIMQKSVSVPGMVVVVAAMLGGSLLGMVGALLAVPTAAAILLIIREVVIPRQNRH